MKSRLLIIIGIIIISSIAIVYVNNNYFQESEAIDIRRDVVEDNIQLDCDFIDYWNGTKCIPYDFETSTEPDFTSSPEPEGGNPKLAELKESGGFIIETRTLRFPERTYTTLANHEDTKNEWFIVNEVLAFGSEMHEVIIPTTLDLYTDDGKVTSVMSYVSLEETIEYAKTLELDSGYIDLNDYVDPNWTDGPTETLDEVPQVEPEITPPLEPSFDSKEDYSIEITGLKDVYLLGEQYDFSYIISGYGNSCGSKTITFPDSNGNAIGSASSASCIADVPMEEFVFDVQKEYGTTYGHVEMQNPGTYTVIVTFDRPSQYFPTTVSKEFRVVEE